MNKTFRNLAIFALSAVMAVSGTSAVFAAGSPQTGGTPVAQTGVAVASTPTQTAAAVTTSTDGGATLESIQANVKTVKVGTVVTVNGQPTAVVTVGGVNYKLETIAKSAVSTTKTKKVTLTVNSDTKFNSYVIGSKARKSGKLKNVYIKTASGKLTAANFDKKAFKKYKGNVRIKKGCMTKTEYKKLKKRLKGVKVRWY